MRLALALLLSAVSSAAQAHRPSDAFLTLVVDGSRVSGRWEIALRDLDVVATVDADGDRVLTWGELRSARARIDARVDASLALHADGRRCPLRTGALKVNDRVEGRFAWIELAAECPAAPAELSLDYQLLFGVDPTHRGILVLAAGPHSYTAIFSPDAPQASFRLGTPSSLRQFLDYLREGAHHIWIGADHILFLLSLLLPCVLRREGGAWRAVERPGPMLRGVVAVVTAFTLAHSITLSLAAFGVLRLPTALTESAIALSVLFVALNNLWPVLTRGRWAAAFGFGLVHGFGFASVLGELGLPRDARLLALVSFNLGVELGQLAIVAIALPLAWRLRLTGLYQRVLFAGGSLVIAAIAAYWFAQRSGLISP